MTIVSRASATTDDGTERGCGRVQRAIWPRTAGSRVVDYVVDYLTAAGVGHVFGVHGANIEDLYDAAFFCPDVTAVLAKHEFSAATMADGYSRATAGLGVVAATSGGGALNLVAGLGESYASRVPVLALVGQSPTALDGRGAFQDTSGRNGSLNAEALFSAVSVYCRRIVDPDHILTALPEAVAAARDGGPAVLLLPKDVQQATVHTNGALTVNGQRPCPEDPYPILRALHGASGPVTIIAGEQVARDDARDELEQLRAALHARVATVPDAKDVSRHRPEGVSVAGRDRGDGPSRGRRRNPQRCGVPAGGHPLAGHRPRRSGCGAARDLHPVDRVRPAVSAVYPRAHQRPSGVVG